MPRAIADALGLKRFETWLVLEGGAIDVNGHGKLLATEECLLSSGAAAESGRVANEA